MRTQTQIANPVQLDKWLSRFVIEIQRTDGKPYPPSTLYQIFCGLSRHIRETRPGINIFIESCCDGFRKTLDGQMKRLRSLGHGVVVRQAEPVTTEEEEKLWQEGLLGDHSPQTLLDTILFSCGLAFAMRSGEEHRSLQLPQFKLVESATDGSNYLVYNENYSKNNSGGLKDRKVRPKSVTHYANETNPGRCLVRLFKKYLSHRPDTSETAFYLTPLQKPKGNAWYSSVPVGRNTLAKTVSRICKACGIEGHKTNHSLRVTAATRLFQGGVDEQIIMQRTGHRSIDGVRKYKRISNDQEKATSSIITNSHSSSSISTSFGAPQITFNNCSSFTININN